MADEKVFLTDERRAVLEGSYDGSVNTERTHKSRIRKKTQLALRELIEVAQSPVIDNSEVFDAGLIEQLITGLYTGGDFEPYRTFDGDRTEYSQHISYQLGLHNRLGRINDEFSDLAHDDPDVHTGLVPPEGYEGIDRDD